MLRIEINQVRTLSAPVVQPMLIDFGNVKLTISVDSSIFLFPLVWITIAIALYL